MRDLLGVILGSIAGFFRGWIDTVVSRVTEITMAFPELLFMIALACTVGNRLNNDHVRVLRRGRVHARPRLHHVRLVLPGAHRSRVVLSLREKEFVEAARMVGASDSRIIRSHILPHLVGAADRLSTLTVAAFILAEAGLSFLGVGIQLPTASWGNLLADAPDFYTTQPWLMVWPGLALLITTLAFNLLGDGLRDAFDPRSTH